MNIFKILIVLFIFVFHLSVQSKSLVRNDISLSSVTSDGLKFSLRSIRPLSQHIAKDKDILFSQSSLAIRNRRRQSNIIPRKRTITSKILISTKFKISTLILDTKSNTLSLSTKMIITANMLIKNCIAFIKIHKRILSVLFIL
jgi:hypothetical protein